MSYNSFKNLRNKNKKEFSFNKNEYPELCSSNTNDHPFSESSIQNFANAILKPIDVINEENVLKPGWIRITKNTNNKIMYEYGPSLIKDSKENPENPNDIMNNIISKLIANRERYRYEYNSINGPFAFEDFYEKYLPIDEDDEEYNIINDDEEEYNEDYI
jgi:hypothetical protein